MLKYTQKYKYISPTNNVTRRLSGDFREQFFKKLQSGVKL